MNKKINGLIKPKIDNNEYKFITLDNKLEVLIIYDKETDYQLQPCQLVLDFIMIHLKHKVLRIF